MDTELYLDLPARDFEPGEMIRGEVLWALPESPKRLTLSLGWWTEGRGTKDAKIETELEWLTQHLAGKESFELQLPKTPYSFNGHLITLKWALELRTEKGRHEHIVEICVAPNRVPVALNLLEDERPRKSFSLFGNR